MEISQTPQFKQAVALEGWLGKQRPGAFHIYQKRYCKFLDGGLTFAYAESKEDLARNKLSGEVPMKDIIELVFEEKPKKFQIILQGIVYKFEAASTPEKYKWVNAIKICRSYAIQYEIKSKEQMLALDSDIRFEETELQEEDPTQQANFNPLGVIATTATKVFVGTAIKAGVGVVKSSVGSSINGNFRSNEEYLKAKKLDQVFSHIDPKLLKSRLMMGYIWKETKEATGVGLVDSFVNESGIRDTIARRWCLMVSSKPIILDDVDPSDEVTLDTGKLPFDIEFEVLYVYDDECDGSKPFKSIQLKDIIDLVVKKKTPDEQFYRFLVDIGERKISFLLTNITEMTSWVKAIQAARANIKEKAKSKLPTVKNMFWHLKIMNESGENKLREKINRDYDTLTRTGGIIRSDNIKELIRVQEKVADDFIAAVNALLVHKDQRIDIIRIYIETSHELILNTLRTYFKKNQENLENKDIFEIIQFLIWYCGRLKIFGDAFVDQRMINGITTLCRIIGIRILKNNMRAVKNIIKLEIEKEPEIDGRGRAATSAPNDIFTLANETFNILTYCNTKELSLALLETCSNTLIHFQNGLNYLLESGDLTLDQLCAFCNNAWTYTTSTKEFCKQVEQLTSTSRETINQYFDESAFNKGFVSLGRKGYEIISRQVFSPLSEQWEKVSFLDIKLEKSMGPIMGVLNQLLDKIHNNFTNKIEALCLEKTVAYYVQAFLVSADKKRFKTVDLPKITAKFKQDQKLLGEIFSNLKNSVVDSAVQSISIFSEFLTANYSFLPMTIQTMKEQYGNSVKYSTIELLIKLRNDKIDKDERNELFKNCEDIYKSTQKKQDKTKSFNVFKHVNQSFEDENGNKSSPQRSDANSSFSDDAGSDTSRNDSTQSNKIVASVILEGYLEADRIDVHPPGTIPSMANLKLELKYFDLKKDVLYYYKEKTSEYPLGIFKLKDLAESGIFEDDHNLFFITLRSKDGGETLTLRLRASSPEKRDQWLEGIREACKHSDSTTIIELNSLDIQLFKDSRALFADIEDMPGLEFNLGPIARSPSVSSRKDSIFGLSSTRTSVATPDMLPGGRRRSFDINGNVPAGEIQKGCVARICNIFWKPKNNDNHYRAI